MAKRPSKARTGSGSNYIDAFDEQNNIGAYWGQVKSGVQSEQFRVICGILLAMFSMYLLIAFVSFFLFIGGRALSGCRNSSISTYVGARSQAVRIRMERLGRR